MCVPIMLGEPPKHVFLTFPEAISQLMQTSSILAFVSISGDAEPNLFLRLARYKVNFRGLVCLICV